MQITNFKNPLLSTDSYKHSHFMQYPAHMTNGHAYIESRGGKYDRIVVFGLQSLLKELFLTPITQADIDEAAWICEAHGEPFNREGWEYILRVHNGFMPMSIKAVPEGTVVPTHVAVVTTEITDPVCSWLNTFWETPILRAVWYGTTVATNSWQIKRIIKSALEKSGDIAGLPFKLHDFGARGVSSRESAALGGAAHLVNFMGTDTMDAILHVMQYYNVKDMPAFSIPASEHSTITSWLRSGEGKAYKNMIKQFGGKFPLFACVSDSYDIFNACSQLWGTELKEEILQCGSTLVVRPDSGDPITTVLKVMQLLHDKFGCTKNDKGFWVLPPSVRIIQGDGVNAHSIEMILTTLMAHGYSADNIAFGMGGALLQGVNRDDQKFAMKCSAVEVEGEVRDVYKDPITDSGKASKKGILGTYRNPETGVIFTGRRSEHEGWEDNIIEPQRLLQEVYRNGKLYVDLTFDEIRQNSNK